MLKQKKEPWNLLQLDPKNLKNLENLGKKPQIYLNLFIGEMFICFCIHINNNKKLCDTKIMAVVNVVITTTSTQ